MTYAAEVLADSPYAYYKFDETSGTTAADSSGNGRNGTYGTSILLNQPTLINTGSSIQIPSAAGTGLLATHGVTTPALSLGTVWTVEMWGRITASPTTYKTIAAQTTATGIWLVNNTPTLFYNGTDHTFSNLPIAQTTDLFPRHYVFVNDGTRVVLWMNGEYCGTVGSFGVAFTVNSIGADAGGTSDVWAGYIDEWSCYTTALSYARVRAHYEAGRQFPAPFATIEEPILFYAGDPAATGNSTLFSLDDARGTVSGTVQVNGTPQPNRMVRVYWRDNGAQVAQRVTDGSGAFSVSGLDRNKKYFVVAFDDTGTAPDYNAQIFDMITPL